MSGAGRQTRPDSERLGPLSHAIEIIKILYDILSPIG
jgi:hypothetical protein